MQKAFDRRLSLNTCQEEYQEGTIDNSGKMGTWELVIPQGRTHQFVVESPGNMYTGDIIWTEWIIFRKLHVHMHAYLHTYMRQYQLMKNEAKSLMENRKVWKEGSEKCFNYTIISKIKINKWTNSNPHKWLPLCPIKQIYGSPCQLNGM